MRIDRDVWRWDGPNPVPGCTCGCPACVENIGLDYEVECPSCPVHGRMTDEELSREWAARTADLGKGDDR